MVHDRLIGVTILVSFLILQPGDEVGQDHGDVVRFKLEVRVVIEGLAIREQRRVDEVPVRLPIAALGLDFVSPGSAFDEAVLFRLRGSPLGIDPAQWFQNLIDSLNSLRTFGLEDVVSNAGGQ